MPKFRIFFISNLVELGSRAQSFSTGWTCNQCQANLYKFSEALENRWSRIKHLLGPFFPVFPTIQLGFFPINPVYLHPHRRTKSPVKHHRLISSWEWSVKQETNTLCVCPGCMQYFQSQFPRWFYPMLPILHCSKFICHSARNLHWIDTFLAPVTAAIL